MKFDEDDHWDCIKKIRQLDMENRRLMEEIKKLKEMLVEGVWE
jgi:hypothetical protein